MTDPMPITPPDVVAGMLAEALDEAMQRLHNTHRCSQGGTADFSWRTCVTSTLCRNTSRLFDWPEVQLAIAAAKTQTGADR